MEGLLKGWKQLCIQGLGVVGELAICKVGLCLAERKAYGVLAPCASCNTSRVFFPARIQMGMWSRIAVSSEVFPYFF